jgi:hypothetical protein
MALWGISTTTETSANNYNLPKYVHTVARSNDRHNVFADPRGWVLRHYKTKENSGLSTHYYDEVLVPIVGLTTNGGGANTKGLNAATPVAVFFEDPNKNSIISVGSGGTSGISTGTTGYVHVVYNELVFAGVGATVLINQTTSAGVSTGTPIVATSTAIDSSVTVANWTYPPFTSGNPSSVLTKGYNGQITNRVAFSFTVPSTGIGTVLTISEVAGVAGVAVTDIDGSNAQTSLTGLTYNVGGAGTAFSLQKDGVTPVGIGTHTLTIKA